MAIKGIPEIFDTAGASATGAIAGGAGLGSSIMGITGPLGAFTGLVGLFKKIDENKEQSKLKKTLRRRRKRLRKDLLTTHKIFKSRDLINSL